MGDILAIDRELFIQLHQFTCVAAGPAFWQGHCRQYAGTVQWMYSGN